jgi:uncharacterized protein (TIGR03437 family)
MTRAVRWLAGGILSLFAAMPVFAQPDRITAIDQSRAIALKGNAHPKARLPQEDLGPAEPSLQLGYVSMLFRPSPDQQAALDRLLVEQRDPSSLNYHKWLKPEEYADRFGLSARDTAKIAAWLRSEGLTVAHVARSRNWIAFNGSAERIGNALHCEIHRYRVSGGTHFAPASEPFVPAALADIVSGFRGLDDFPAAGPKIVQPAVQPAYNRLGAHLLAPSDLAAIYDIAPLYAAGIDGTGQKIAIAGGSALDLSDIRTFRQLFKLPANDPVTILVGSDPGKIPSVLLEADLDVEWAGAIAPNASVIYVYSQDLLTAAQAAIDQNVAPVLSMSFGECEPEISPAFQIVAQQGNAQGITLIAASGDGGAAQCDAANGRPQASNGPAVGIPASIPEVTAVGGTQFNEAGGAYWNSANTPNGASALSYIPEKAWNESGPGGLAASGGGASILFSKPAWQTGPGVPNDNARDVPDVSLSSAAHDGYFIYSNGLPIGVYGTSAAAPSFAGIVALLNQYLASNGSAAQPGLGNINPSLYRLAQSAPTAFHDIVTGDNKVPCSQSSPGCGDGAIGYSAGPGYDMATGLGSIDANNLITQWNRGPAGTTTTLSTDQAAVSLNGALQLTASVSGSSVAALPSGTVSFMAGGATLGTAPITASGAATLSVFGDQLRAGQVSLTAIYSGDGNFSGSSASAVVTVSAPAGASAVVPSISPNPVLGSLTTPDTWIYAITLSEQAGVSTTLTDFTINGVSHASEILKDFSGADIAAKGKLSAGSLSLANLTAPAKVVFGFSGVDASGQTWSQQVSVPFLQPPLRSELEFEAYPSTVRQDPGADPACQWAQLLTVQSSTGFAMQLTRLAAGFNDVTAQISQIFGSTRLAPFGALQGKLCWTGVTRPQTSDLELDAIDEFGNVRSTTLTQTLLPAAAPLIPTTVSPDRIELSAADSSQTAMAGIGVDFASSAPAAWTVQVFPNNVTTSWLTVSPLSGSGPAQLNLTASAAGLANGVYNATVTVRAPGSTPAYSQTPVVLIVGDSSAVSISGVANGASAASGYAPGMLLTVTGSGLAGSTGKASGPPWNLTMAGVSATINGISAPVSAVAPGQLTIQIPYDVGSGTAVLGVNNNGQIASYIFQMAPSAPGIFTDSNGALAPTASGQAGQPMALYMTGEGDVSPSLLTGDTPIPGTPQSRLPRPLLTVSVTVGGLPAAVSFAGVTSGLVGESQVNFTIPPDVTPGPQPVVVTVGGVSSPPALLTVTPSQ